MAALTALDKLIDSPDWCLQELANALEIETDDCDVDFLRQSMKEAKKNIRIAVHERRAERIRNGDV